MAAPHAHNLANPAQNPTPKKRAIGSLYDLIHVLFVESPRWVRIVMVLGVAIALALGIYKRMSGSSDSPKQATREQPAYPIDKGEQVAPPGNGNRDPRNIDATQKIKANDEHFGWHAVHDQVDPGWSIISKQDDSNLIEYKYYRNSDRCILFLRLENGEGSPQWIRDPVFARAADNRAQSQRPISVSMGDLLIGTASAAPPESRSLKTDSHLQPIQGGCMNPHPWVFQWWWGPPADQCWSPMFRRWADGCQHHQMFNRCINNWDPNIIWDFCAGQHHP